MRFLPILLLALGLCACANRATTDVESEDASLAMRVKFGTVLAQRPVSVRTDPTTMMGFGAFGGGLTGAALSATNAGALAGFALGGAAAGLAHRIGENDNGVEYTIALGSGETIVIDQIQRSWEPVLQPGDAVLVQYGAKINRVLPARDLPAEVGMPKMVQVTGAEPPPDKANVRACVKGALGESTREVCTQH